MSIESTLPTPIVDLGKFDNNHLWIKREDLIPFSFGGNKARKAEKFFREIDKGEYDCIVTYGSGSSNHCRVIANECCIRGIDCIIICPLEASEQTFNSLMMRIFGATTIIVPVSDVHDTIERKIDELRMRGRHPFFIEGGGHGNIGTEAYVQCYEEIRQFEITEGIHFDFIFFASGTGTTQAGLICGQLIYEDTRKIIGISIARKNPRGRDIIKNSVRSFMGDRANELAIDEKTIFIDRYTAGYGKTDELVLDTINYVLKNYGIPLDKTYTGTAFLGMTKYLESYRDKNALFIHTGGTPLFFDTLRIMNEVSI